MARRSVLVSLLMTKSMAIIVLMLGNMFLMVVLYKERQRSEAIARKWRSYPDSHLLAHVRGWADANDSLPTQLNYTREEIQEKDLSDEIWANLSQHCPNDCNSLKCTLSCGMLSCWDDESKAVSKRCKNVIDHATGKRYGVEGADATAVRSDSFDFVLDFYCFHELERFNFESIAECLMKPLILIVPVLSSRNQPSSVAVVSPSKLLKYMDVLCYLFQRNRINATFYEAKDQPTRFSASEDLNTLKCVAEHYGKSSLILAPGYASWIAYDTRLDKWQPAVFELNLKGFSQAIRTQLGLNCRTCSNIVLILRSKRKRRSFIDGDALVDAFRAEFGNHVQIYNGDEKFYDTARMFHGACAVVGYHGAGSTNSMYTCPGTMMMEINTYFARMQGTASISDGWAFWRSNQASFARNAVWDMKYIEHHHLWPTDVHYDDADNTIRYSNILLTREHIDDIVYRVQRHLERNPHNNISSGWHNSFADDDGETVRQPGPRGAGVCSGATRHLWCGGWVSSPTRRKRKPIEKPFSVPDVMLGTVSERTEWCSAATFKQFCWQVGQCTGWWPKVLFKPRHSCPIFLEGKVIAADEESSFMKLNSIVHAASSNQLTLLAYFQSPSNLSLSLNFEALFGEGLRCRAPEFNVHYLDVSIDNISSVRSLVERDICSTKQTVSVVLRLSDTVEREQGINPCGYREAFVRRQDYLKEHNEKFIQADSYSKLRRWVSDRHLRIAVHIPGRNVLCSNTAGISQFGENDSPCVPNNVYLNILARLFKVLREFSEVILHVHGAKSVKEIPDVDWSVTDFESELKILGKCAVGSDEPMKVLESICMSHVAVGAGTGLLHTATVLCPHTLTVTAPYHYSFDYLPNAVVLQSLEETNQHNDCGSQCFDSNDALRAAVEQFKLA